MNQLFLAKTNGFNFYMLGVGVTNLLKNVHREHFLAKRTISHFELTGRGRPSQPVKHTGSYFWKHTLELSVKIWVT